MRERIEYKTTRRGLIITAATVSAALAGASVSETTNAQGVTGNALFGLQDCNVAIRPIAESALLGVVVGLFGGVLTGFYTGNKEATDAAIDARVNGFARIGMPLGMVVGGLVGAIQGYRDYISCKAINSTARHL